MVIVETIFLGPAKDLYSINLAEPEGRSCCRTLFCHWSIRCLYFDPVLMICNPIQTKSACANAVSPMQLLHPAGDFGLLNVSSD